MEACERRPVAGRAYHKIATNAFDKKNFGDALIQIKCAIAILADANNQKALSQSFQLAADIYEAVGDNDEAQKMRSIARDLKVEPAVVPVANKINS